jgi:hypothetical protein
MIGLDFFTRDTVVIWATRVCVLALAALILALVTRLIYGAIRGRIDLADLLTGPSGRLSWSRAFGTVAAGASTMMLMELSAAGKLSWEHLMVYLAAAGLVDLGKRGLTTWETVTKTKQNGGSAESKPEPTRMPRGEI